MGTTAVASSSGFGRFSLVPQLMLKVSVHLQPPGCLIHCDSQFAVFGLAVWPRGLFPGVLWRGRVLAPGFSWGPQPRIQVFS